eukprot:gene7527-13308_t
MEQKGQSTKNTENVGLLFGYHKELYKNRYDKPSLAQQCCSVYCARGSNTLFALSFSVALIIIGTLCTVYGYFLPSLFLSLSSDVSENMTMTMKNSSDLSRFEKESKSLSDIYEERDGFVIAGLVILFCGGLVVSLALLLPLCMERGIGKLPSSSHIMVKNELGDRGARIAENSLNSYTEETRH